MSLIAKRHLAHNSTELPLFEWAARDTVVAVDQLLITRKVAGRLKISPSIFNVMAVAHGFRGREACND